MRFLKNVVFTGQPINKMPLTNWLTVILAILNNQGMSVWTQKIRILPLTGKLSQVQNGRKQTFGYGSTLLSTDEAGNTAKGYWQ